MVYKLAYVSTAVGGVERARLADILAVARTRNTRLGITGVLLYRDGRFLQLLEGHAPSVASVYRSITADPRHTDVRCVSAGHGPERWFSNWSMGFRDLTDDPLGRAGYTNLLSDTAPDPSSSTLYELWRVLRPNDAQTDGLDQPRPHQDRRSWQDILGVSALLDNLRRELARSPHTSP